MYIEYTVFIDIIGIPKYIENQYVLYYRYIPYILIYIENPCVLKLYFSVYWYSKRYDILVYNTELRYTNLNGIMKFSMMNQHIDKVRVLILFIPKVQYTETFDAVTVWNSFIPKLFIRYTIQHFWYGVSYRPNPNMIHIV